MAQRQPGRSESKSEGTALSIPALIWSLADLLRGEYKQSDYGKVILPFTVLRRLDCVLRDTKSAVLAEYEARKGLGIPLHDFLVRKAKQTFYNTSPLDFEKLLADPQNIGKNLLSYVSAFSDDARDIFDRYDFSKQVQKLDEANLLYLIVEKFASVDLHPSRVSHAEMGTIFEELIRRFAELSNETAGEHYTPREVIRLMAYLLLDADSEALSQEGVIRSLYDPTAGTGGMLSVAEDYIHLLNPRATLRVFGQELNPESYAICKADMLIKGHDVTNIVLGNTLSADGHAGQYFDYGLANPPYGVDWKKVEKEVVAEHQAKGYSGRFGPGLPRVSDGSLLFLLHLISKIRPIDPVTRKGGGRVGIVLNGSPLFTGGAGSGESEIRRWIIEHDLLELIVALPTEMFYNTGIATYVWILTNNKRPERKGKVQLINAVSFCQRMRKGLGQKRNELTDEHIAQIAKLYGAFEEGEFSRIFDNEDFGYTTITVERPLRLNFAVTEERLTRVRENGVLAKLGAELPILLQALASLGTGRVWKNRDGFLKDLRRTLAEAHLTLSAPQMKTLITALSERDETADTCLDGKGRPEPDPELRDTENVPLKEDIRAYFEREVLPYAPDAWIDEARSKVGYEIPFTRHFYKYVPPRSLDAIDEDLKALSSEIATLLSHAVTKGLDPSVPMKDSGVEWIGRMPDHWHVAQVRTMFRIVNGGTPSSSQSEYWGGDIVWVTPEDLGRQETPLITSTARTLTRAGLGDCGASIVPPGSLVLSTRAPIGHVGLSGTSLCTNQGCKSLVARSEVDSKFVYYQLLAARPELQALGQGSTFQELAASRLAAVKLAVPPVCEQYAISRYLDCEVGRIATLVSKAERAIDLLRERRTALIAAAVTGQIDVRATRSEDLLAEVA